MQHVKIADPKKPVPGDVNYITRQKEDKPRDGQDKGRFDRNYDSINWKSKAKAEEPVKINLAELLPEARDEMEHAVTVYITNAYASLEDCLDQEHYNEKTVDKLHQAKRNISAALGRFT